eukprot:1147906-Pelagomonas_calceolata.AAC.2
MEPKAPCALHAPAQTFCKHVQASAFVRVHSNHRSLLAPGAHWHQELIGTGNEYQLERALNVSALAVPHSLPLSSFEAPILIPNQGPANPQMNRPFRRQKPRGTCVGMML